MAVPDEPRLRRVPNRGETLESWGITIEWDVPKPTKVVAWKPNMQSWYRRLAPLKSTPGRRARVLRDLKNKDIARARVGNMRNSLRERDPRSKWKIESAKADDGTYGVWVTYNGVMSDKEYEEREALFAYRSRQAKLRLMNSQKKKVLQRSLRNPSLRPPVVRPDD
jgi:hypothetical protein